MKDPSPPNQKLSRCHQRESRAFIVHLSFISCALHWCTSHSNS